MDRGIYKESEIFMVVYTDVEDGKYKTINDEDGEPIFFQSHEEALEKGYNLLPVGTVVEVFMIVSSHEVVV